VAIATKNALRGTTEPAYRSDATVRRSIPATTEGVSCSKELQRRKLLHVGPQVPSGRHFTFQNCHRGNPTPQLQQTSCWNFLQLTPNIRRIQPRRVHQIMAGLQTADSEEDRFSVIMRAVGGWVGPRAGLDTTVVKRKIPSRHRDSNPRSSSP
jgi:hypothetical protein